MGTRALAPLQWLHDARSDRAPEEHRLTACAVSAASA